MRNFLTTFSTKLGQDPISSANAKSALDYVFGQERDNLARYRPSQAETGEFLDLLRRAVVAEGKVLSQQRSLALASIIVYNKNPVSQFQGIAPAVFAFQLAARVREPSLIDQAWVGLCGVNSLMIAFAKTDPQAFVGYALSLIRTGSGKIGNMTITPAWTTKRGWYEGKMTAADIVILGSLGISAMFGGSGAIPRTVCGWLESVGLQNVQDKTKLVTTQWHRNSILQNLRSAEADVNAGQVVIIATNHALEHIMLATKPREGDGQRYSGAVLQGHQKVGPQIDGPARTAVLRFTNHWTLVSRLTVTDKTVDIKLYTWRNSIQRSLALDTFLSYYGGYIVARASTRITRPVQGFAYG